MIAQEHNFDGLVGPTHNYAGLAFGNEASMRNAAATSRPKAAALQGLQKMRALLQLGVPQGVLPPQERPHVATLRALGLKGSDAEIARAAAREPGLIAAVSSASSMWAANAATVSASADTADGRVHFTPANLQAQLHRSIEAAQTDKTLRAIFPAGAHFAHHGPLPACAPLADEGAANHTRLETERGALDLFVWGRARGDRADATGRYPARQALGASQRVAARHTLDPDRTLFVRQRPEAIAAGVFHNDVAAVGYGPVLLLHELAWSDQQEALARCRALLGAEFTPIVIPAERVPLTDAVESYLFNSQIVRDAGGDLVLIAARESERNERARRAIEELIAGPGLPIARALFVDVTESMRNGGGPACLRLRVPLTDEERAAVAPGCLVDEAKIEALKAWIERHYRDELTPHALADPALLAESRTALDELTRLLSLGPIYPFQGA